MIRLVYVSSSPELLSQEDLVDVLRTNAQNNERDQITGILVYEGGDFMQVLEGPEGLIGQVLKRVGIALEGSNANVLLREEIDSRYFETWTMAFATKEDLGQEDEEYLSDFLERGDLPDPQEAGAEAAHQMLMAFRSRKETEIGS